MSAIGQLTQAIDDGDHLIEMIASDIAEIQAMQTMISSKVRTAETMISFLQVIGSDTLGDVNTMTAPIRGTEGAKRQIEYSYSGLDAAVANLKGSQNALRAVIQTLQDFRQRLLDLES